MRKITNNPKFDYILLCNKICGAAHYNMHMKVVVDSQKGFYAWLKKQKAFMPDKLAGNQAPQKSDTTKKAVADTLKTAQLVKK